MLRVDNFVTENNLDYILQTDFLTFFFGKSATIFRSELKFVDFAGHFSGHEEKENSDVDGFFLHAR